MGAFHKNKALEHGAHSWHDATQIMSATDPFSDPGLAYGAPAKAGSHLLPFLMGAYALLIINASLYPFSGWRAPAELPWTFLTAVWPRYLHTWEIPLNVAAYLPLGFLLALHFLPRHRWRWSMVLSSIIGLALSFCLESLQNYLPTRIASNLDLGSNALGAFLGAAAGCVMDETWSLRARLHAYRFRRVSRGVMADFAITVTLIWLFVQINPEIGFLGTGDLGALLGHGNGLPYSAGTYFFSETLLTAMNLISICALLSALALSRRSWVGGAAILLSCGALLKALAAQALLRTPQPLVWLTPGLATGVLLGAIILGLWHWKAGKSMKVLGLGALVGANALSWVVPVNPYLAIIVQPISHAHVSSINGATWWVAQLWPWLALLCLLRIPLAHYANCPVADDSGR